ncbi:hypothetical protein [Clostridium sp. FP1]|uniref:hypothetical protein n=1 Tax=Clostridium sp. FP1 TaxID=2724076 RepID=UPI001651FBCF|nr:hypothetical protein [Clostridium sp. FP1]MBZ9633333.1 hypothetical protein [Clostridium sp. FP1]
MCCYAYNNKQKKRKDINSNYEYCEKELISSTGNKKYCSHDYYIRDRFWRKEDATEVTKKLLKGEKLGRMPKWLRDRFKEGDRNN